MSPGAAQHLVLGDAPPSAHGYFQRHYLNFGERVEDGFVDPGRMIGAHRLPSATELEQRPFGVGEREVLLVDTRTDERLRERIDCAKAEVRMITDLRDRIKVLAGFASDELGYVSALIGTETEKHLAALMSERHSAIVPLGMLDFGVCRHRALLFKVLCDATGIDCRLVRGDFDGNSGDVGGPHSWNVVRVNGELCVVDVMRSPGAICSEADAVNQYHRLVERGANPGAPGGLGAGLASIPPAPRSEWYLPPALIEIERRADGSENKLGEGGFSVVFRGTLRGVDRVALKRLLNATTPAAASEFSAEVSTLWNLRHSNILILRGACDDVGNLMMVTELMAGGDLAHAMCVAPAQLAWAERGRHVALQVADALHYLHTLEPPVVHRDIKPHNVLLTAEYSLAKLADFGLARTKFHSSMSAQHAYTAAYAAPEVLSKKHATEKVDVYSFGVLLQELLTQKKPTEGEKLRLPASVQPLSLRRLVLKCMEQSPHVRPSSAELVLGLRELAGGSSVNPGSASAMAAAEAGARQEAAAEASREAEEEEQTMREVEEVVVPPAHISALLSKVSGGKLSELNLVNKDIDDRIVRASLGAFFGINASLAVLNLNGNRIADAGAMSLGKALEVNASITTLGLARNVIGYKGAKAIAKCLSKANASLTALDLHSNQIGDEGASGLAKGLKVNASLTKLTLWGNQIADVGANGLSKSLESNTSLTMLDLGCNMLTSAAAINLSEAFDFNASLAALILYKNQIAETGAFCLAASLENNTSSLKKLDLRWNLIGDDGKSAVRAAWNSGQRSAVELLVDFQKSSA